MILVHKMLHGTILLTSFVGTATRIVSCPPILRGAILFHLEQVHR